MSSVKPESVAGFLELQLECSDSQSGLSNASAAGYAQPCGPLVSHMYNLYFQACFDEHMFCIFHMSCFSNNVCTQGN